MAEREGFELGRRLKGISKLLMRIRPGVPCDPPNSPFLPPDLPPRRPPFVAATKVDSALHECGLLRRQSIRRGGARFTGSARTISPNQLTPFAACSISLITACGCET